MLRFHHLAIICLPALFAPDCFVSCYRLLDSRSDVRTCLYACVCACLCARVSVSELNQSVVSFAIFCFVFLRSFLCHATCVFHFAVLRSSSPCFPCASLLSLFSLLLPSATKRGREREGRQREMSIMSPEGEGERGRKGRSRSVCMLNETE